MKTTRKPKKSLTQADKNAFSLLYEKKASSGKIAPNLLTGTPGAGKPYSKRKMAESVTSSNITSITNSNGYIPYTPKFKTNPNKDVIERGAKLLAEFLELDWDYLEEHSDERMGCDIWDTDRVYRGGKEYLLRLSEQILYQKVDHG